MAEDFLPVPAFLHVPERVSSLVLPVSRLAEALGRPLDEQQRVAVDALTSRRADGLPSTLEAAVICPRQNMKTWILQLIVLARLLEPGGDSFIVWSAHLFDTAQETFSDFQELIASHAWLDGLVMDVKQGNGTEQITFRGERNGRRWSKRRLRFRARGKTGARGLSGDCVVLDEAFALQPVHMGALLPILSTRKRAQVLYGSSAGMPTSTVLRGIRDRGRAGGKNAPAYVEFCAPGSLDKPGCGSERCVHAPGTPGCVMDREDFWLAANPAASAGRISLEYLRSERLGLPPEEFARERLGWWDEPVSGLAALPSWGGLVDPDGQWIDGEFVLAFDVSMGSRWASVGLAGRRHDGTAQLEVLRRDRGTEWLVDFVATAAQSHGGALRVLANDYPTCKALFPDLAARDVRVQPVTRGELAASCGWLEQACATKSVRHLGDPVLDAALVDAVKADFGDGGWAWSRRKSEADISALIAVTVAGFGLRSTPENNLFVG